MSCTVLVIDDDPAIRLVTKRLLKMLKCEAHEAKNGVEGEKLALQLQPDLVLLDIMMPLQDGYETCKRLRAQGFQKPIILFSTLLRENERIHAQRIGATDYLQKPIQKEMLQEFLKLNADMSA